jgi:hypothetical protein
MAKIGKTKLPKKKKHSFEERLAKRLGIDVSIIYEARAESNSIQKKARNG